MSDEFLTGIALIIAIIVGVFKYKKNGNSKKEKFIENAKKTGCYTTGVCVDTKLYWGNPDSSDPRFRHESIKVKYKYTINGIDYYKRMEFQSIGKVAIDYPSQVTVYYDSHKPKKAVCPEETTVAKRIEGGCLSAIFVACLTLFCVFHILRFLFR